MSLISNYQFLITNVCLWCYMCAVYRRQWTMRNEQWGMNNEEWTMRNEQWGMNNEEWTMRNEQWGTYAAITMIKANNNS